jgi:uncharacterized protein YdhG (YjbR/CyaY superfamily)
MATATKRISPTTVDQYLDALRKPERQALENLRKTIKSVLPYAEEVISYHVPVFKQNGGLVGYAAFKDHCSFLVMSSTLLKNFTQELKDYKTTTGTIHFTINKPLPGVLVKKIVAARMKENEEILLSRRKNKPAAKKSRSPKISDEESVKEYMSKLQHPLKAEIEVLRTIIKDADSKIAERIKWNAPSYYYKDDMVTFNHRATRHVHLVFHHPAIATIQSHLLEGDYKDRRMAYFTNMADVKARKNELVRIMNELVNLADR